MNVSEALSILWFRTTLLLNKQQILINQMSESRYEYVYTFENLNTQTSVFWRTERAEIMTDITEPTVPVLMKVIFNSLFKYPSRVLF